MPNILIKSERPRIDDLLARYQSNIGDDFPAYRNHVYRATTYAMHFLNHDPKAEALVETAFAYHDLGLWTHAELAYLEPSETLALADNECFNWGLDPDALRGAIHWHHKVTPYTGPHANIIEACRKADWIDASKGLIRKGLAREDIRAVEAAFPNHGFHKTLIRLTKDLGGSVFTGGIRVTKGIVRW